MEPTNKGEAGVDLILKFEEEEKTEVTSSVPELMRMVSSFEDNSDVSQILEEVPKGFLCNQCESTFKTKSGLATHTRSHKARKRKADLQPKGREQEGRGRREL